MRAAIKNNSKSIIKQIERKNTRTTDFNHKNFQTIKLQKNTKLLKAQNKTNGKNS